MATPTGIFDPEFVDDGWFDPGLAVKGWFDPELLDWSTGSAFPTQYQGLRYYHGTVKELCMVDWADAPAGNRLAVRKNGVTYAAYLVDTSDPDASPVRVQTSSGVKAIRYYTSSGPTDSLFSSTKLLLGFEGVDGATSGAGFTDESAAARGAASLYGTAQIDTAQAKYGSSSLLLDGDSDGIYYPDSADWNLAGINFCIEGWVRLASTSGLQFFIMKCDWDDLGNPGWLSFFNNGVFYYGPTFSPFFLQDSSGAVSANTWYHMAIDYDGTKHRMFRDGVMVASSTTSIGYSDGTQPFSIGTDSDGSLGYFNGWIDEVRFTHASRYGSDSSFTPPTAAFPRS